MYGHGPHASYHQQPPAPRPPPSGLSPLAIALLVIGTVVVLGGGACVVAGALVFVSTKAEAERLADAGAAAPLNGAASGQPADDPPAHAEGQEPSADDEPAVEEPSPDARTGSGAAKNAGKGKAAAGGGSWFCTASAPVRVCGFAGACNYQTVFGNGSGPDRTAASMQARNACQASARAKGATAVCVAQCSAR